ncbi:hypothetical protein LTR56_026835 [Elasticomyces elasticus]|nr:hypothetical protein LTR56_026835 [Elasticomyces elasticus]KAK3637611.1 hypothetical protein LTR22_018174 [Elasticomyces elasticus]KAK4900198.1 hypothetical protein LTR49_027489 [Elasticomyces elasticus]KAK5735409.1 hypothetical protein LTS12_026475 [Elasticomyces elasticus]
MTESIFIISNGPKVPKEARTTIRKQAMRDIGLARKARGGYGRINVRQGVQYADSHEGSIPFRSAVGMTLSRSSSTTLSSRSSSRAPAVRTPNTSQPSTVDWDEFVEAVPREDVADDYANDQSTMSCNLMLPSLSPVPDYERARSKFGIDLMSLSILTNFNVGKSTIAILSADPTRLASLLNLAQWSYLEYVPERYGISECLTAATNCLLAKVHTVLAPKEECYAMCNLLYGRALRSLQDAIASDSSAMDADVLCATQLLSLHELLDPSRDTAWSHHVQGSARLVRHRSATRFHTDFERALFAAHVGGIVSECLVNNTHCYLEQPEWIGLYTSLTIESNFLSERSPLAISLRVTMFELPGIWHDVGEAVNELDFYSDWPLAALEARCRKAHRELLVWLEQYKAHCVRLSLAQPPASELSLRRELFGSALECLAIVKRLLCTVCESDRRNLEVETQALAHLILDLQKQPSPKHSWLFSGHEVGVAYTVLLTKDQWEENVDRRDAHDKKVATKTRYNTWSNTLRMTG